MKMELRIEGNPHGGDKVIVIEATGAVSVYVRDEDSPALAPAVAAAVAPTVAQEKENAPAAAIAPAVAAAAITPVVASVTAPAVALATASENVPQEAQKSIPAANDDLFAKLVQLRRELAIAAGVPPYVIFNDKSLHEMAEKLPQDLTAFANIGGVGKAKLEKYGEIFLSTIKGAAA